MDLSPQFPAECGWRSGVQVCEHDGWRGAYTVVRAAISLNGRPVVATARYHSDSLGYLPMKVILDELTRTLAAEITKALEPVVMSCPGARFDFAPGPTDDTVSFGADLTANYRMGS